MEEGRYSEEEEFPLIVGEGADVLNGLILRALVAVRESMATK